MISEDSAISPRVDREEGVERMERVEGGKRDRTRARLLEEAIRLFRRQGVRATRLSEIASAADVATATLYTHFATKGALVEAWLRGELDRGLEQSARAALSEGRGLRSALRRSCKEWAAASSAEASFRLEAWREVPRARTPAGLQWPALVEALRREQEREHVRSDIGATRLAAWVAEAVESGLCVALGELVMAAESGTPPGSSLASELSACVDLVLDGARKRNERVRPPAPGTSRAAGLPPAGSVEPLP